MRKRIQRDKELLDRGRRCLLAMEIENMDKSDFADVLWDGTKGHKTMPREEVIDTLKYALGYAEQLFPPTLEELVKIAEKDYTY